MSRIPLLIMAAIIAIAFSPSPASAQSGKTGGRKAGEAPPPAKAGKGTLKVGGTFEGEIPATAVAKKYAKDFGTENYSGPQFAYENVNGNRVRIDLQGMIQPRGFATQVPIALKAGQNVSISATVTGSGRKVYLVLHDPTKLPIANTSSVEEKTNTLTIDEVNASGTYQIEIVSDQIGRFTLKVTGSEDEEDEDPAQLEARIAKLERDLANAKAKLKAAKAKSSSNRE